MPNGSIQRPMNGASSLGRGDQGARRDELERSGMGSLTWVMNRLSAAMVGAIIVGFTAGCVVAVESALTCGPTCTSIVSHYNVSHCVAYGTTCGNFFGDLLVTVIWAVPSALLLGTLPGVAALTLTPAKNRP